MRIASSMAESNPPIPASVGVIPPVAMVVSEMFIASNAPSGVNLTSRTNSITVRATNTIHRILAVDWNVRPVGETVGPVSSALASDMPPPPTLLEKMSSPSIMTPMPPSHCVADL